MVLTTLTKLLRLFLVVAASLTLFVLFGVSAPAAHAQTSTSMIPAYDTSACTRQHYNSHDVFCSSPSITAYCSDPQYFSATDGYGHPTDWTYTDHVHHCLTVSFRLSSSFSSCSIELYVPNVYSDANFSYSWYDGTTHYGTLNEAPVDGWQYLFSASTATSLSFTDFQSTGSQHLGWGSSSTDGVRITCG